MKIESKSEKKRLAHLNRSKKFICEMQVRFVLEAYTIEEAQLIANKKADDFGFISAITKVEEAKGF